MNNIINLPVWTAPPKPAGHYTSTEVLTRARITYRQLDYWTRTGRLHPTTHDHHDGPGYPRHYPATEVAVAVLMGRLIGAGLAIEPAHTAARELLATGTTRIAGITIHLPQDA